MNKETKEFFVCRENGVTVWTKHPAAALLCDSRTEAAIRIIELGAAFYMEPALV